MKQLSQTRVLLHLSLKQSVLIACSEMVVELDIKMLLHFIIVAAIFRLGSLDISVA